MNRNVILGGNVMFPPKEKDGLFYVYELCTQDGKPFYVGKGKSSRWNHHEKCAKRECKDNFRVHNKIRCLLQNGEPIIKKIVFQSTDEHAALAEEKRRIAEYGRENLTNLTTGGDGFSHSEESKRKCSAAQKGKPKTPEARQKMSLAKKGFIPWNRGIPRTEQERKKMSENRVGKYKGRPAWNKGLPGHMPWNKGIPLSDETKIKMSAKLRGMPKSKETKINMIRGACLRWLLELTQRTGYGGA